MDDEIVYRLYRKGATGTFYWYSNNKDFYADESQAKRQRTRLNGNAWCNWPFEIHKFRMVREEYSND